MHKIENTYILKLHPLAYALVKSCTKHNEIIHTSVKPCTDTSKYARHLQLKTSQEWKYKKHTTELFPSSVFGK